jgi:hypothetical protein
MGEQTRNSELLEEFTRYCKANPSMRFWQALTNWAKLPYLGWSNKYTCDKCGFTDLWHAEGKNQ